MAKKDFILLQSIKGEKGLIEANGVNTVSLDPALKTYKSYVEKGIISDSSQAIVIKDNELVKKVEDLEAEKVTLNEKLELLQAANVTLKQDLEDAKTPVVDDLRGKK